MPSLASRTNSVVSLISKIATSGVQIQAAAHAVLEAAGKVTKADNAAVVVVALNIPEPLPKRERRQQHFQLKLE